MKEKYYNDPTQENLWLNTWICNNPNYYVQLLDDEHWFRENFMGMSLHGAFKSYKRSESEIEKQPYGGSIINTPKEILELIGETVESLSQYYDLKYVIVTKITRYSGKINK